MEPAAQLNADIDVHAIVDVATLYADRAGQVRRLVRPGRSGPPIR